MNATPRAHHGSLHSGSFEIFTDSVILAEGIEEDKTLIEQLTDLEVETHIIGDAESIGYIEGAIRSGNKVGQLL